jgi:hypothetical protein
MAERKVVIVRLRPALHAALQRWAAAEFRSVNGQIEYLLAQALRRAGRLPRGAEPGGGGAETPDKAPDGDDLGGDPGADP